MNGDAMATNPKAIQNTVPTLFVNFMYWSPKAKIPGHIAENPKPCIKQI